MHKLEISGNAQAFKDPRGEKPITDPGLLSELHGIHSQDICTSYFDDNPYFRQI